MYNAESAGVDWLCCMFFVAVGGGGEGSGLGSFVEWSVTLVAALGSAVQLVAAVEAVFVESSVTLVAAVGSVVPTTGGSGRGSVAIAGRPVVGSGGFVTHACFVFLFFPTVAASFIASGNETCGLCAYESFCPFDC